ncbi:MAG: hypothetical protein ACKV2U_10975 [Bryobacteraceae bacterium]
MNRLFLRLTILGVFSIVLVGCGPKEVKTDTDQLKAEAEKMEKYLKKEHGN